MATMAKKTFTSEQIIGILRQAEILIAQGNSIEKTCKKLGISNQTYYRWRKEYGGMKVEQAKKLKELEKENAQLKKAIAELTLDKLILKEAIEGNY